MLPVSLTLAGALALIGLFLAYRVVRVRIAEKTMMGDGDNPLLRSRMRAQANFVEYSPFVLILTVLIELAGGSPRILWWTGAAYVVARIVHPFGLDMKAPNPLRAGGIFVTWAVLLGLGLWAIWIASHPLPVVHYL